MVQNFFVKVQIIRHPNYLAALVALLFFLLATLYSVVTPVFESPDELWHYPLVWHLARTATLPVQDPANPQLWAQEGSQPPLYYALAALLTAPIPTADLPALIYRNPHADIGLVSQDGNLNIVVHTSQEAWPWRGSVLALHLSRLFSVALATGTVLAIYGLGRTLWPERPALPLLAMTFVAFNPMFLFISGSVNNDNLITLLASLVLWQLVWLVTAAKKEPPWWPFVSLGILCGLAAISKVSGLGLPGLVGITLLVWGVKRRSWRIALLGNGLVGLLAATIAGWWYWRNLILYGDVTGAQNMVALMGARTVTPTAGQLAAELSGLIRSFWGLFGYFSVPMPALIYGLLNLIFVAGMSGWLVVLFSKQKSAPPRLKQSWPILLGWIVILLAGLLQWTLRTPASQGRLLFPALAAIAPLWAMGWLALVPSRMQAAPPVFMLLLSLWVPWGVIAPAYATPATINALPPSAVPIEAIFEDNITLLGYQLEQTTISPGDTLPVTLFWRGEQLIPADYTLFLHLVDEHNLIVTQRDVFHGPGVYPTSQWQPGQTFADTYALQLPTTAYAPAEAHLTVGLYNHTTGERLALATGADHLNFGNITLKPRPGEYLNPQQFQFEDGLNLVGYSLNRRQVGPGEALELTLYWQAQRVPAKNYKVFVHLVGENQTRAAQHDSEPQAGAAPTTGWSPHTVIEDVHLLTITPDAAPGVYQVVIGLYDGHSGQRLRLLKNGTAWLQTDSITVTNLRVSP